MALREIIEIDEELCDGCGQCVPGCAEGALQIVDGKAKLVADRYCDGLGACLGHCPTGALQVIQREADEFDEEAVETLLAQQKTAAETPPPGVETGDSLQCGCPSTVVEQLTPGRTMAATPAGPVGQTASALSHWPVQLRLVPANAPFLKDADILLLADCGALAVPELHQRYVPGKVVLMGCPKFDDAESYVARLKDIFEKNEIRSLTVLEMEVPCCSGLSKIAARAAGLAATAASLTRVVASRTGEELQREELAPATSAFAM